MVAAPPPSSIDQAEGRAIVPSFRAGTNPFVRELAGHVTTRVQALCAWLGAGRPGTGAPDPRSGSCEAGRHTMGSCRALGGLRRSGIPSWGQHRGKRPAKALPGYGAHELPCIGIYQHLVSCDSHSF